jgi:hypothetical protein
MGGEAIFPCPRERSFLLSAASMLNSPQLTITKRGTARALASLVLLCALAGATPASAQCSFGYKVDDTCFVESGIIGCCLSNMIVWCEGGVTCAKDCGENLFYSACGWRSASEEYTCVAFSGSVDTSGQYPAVCGAKAEGPCGSVEAEGCCDGSTLKFCYGGVKHSVDCGALADPTMQSCGWSNQADGYDCGPTSGESPYSFLYPRDCNDPYGSGGNGGGSYPGCIPDCFLSDCGDDGCGGSCGTCAADEECFAGYCFSSGWGDGGGFGCTPDCTGRTCGDDGCGGSCGMCGYGQECDQSTGLCMASCIRQCAGKNCGPDACGSTCGACTGGLTCTAQGVCSSPAGGGSTIPGCAPDCSTKDCGDDGCGGSCGYCGIGRRCSALFVCENCVPECGERECGDDGCGAECGVCRSDEECSPFGYCIPQGCQPYCPNRQCGDDGCGGQCGGCEEGYSCDDDGSCVSPDGDSQPNASATIPGVPADSAAPPPALPEPATGLNEPCPEEQVRQYGNCVIPAYMAPEPGSTRPLTNAVSSTGCSAGPRGSCTWPAGLLLTGLLIATARRRRRR